MTEGRRCQVHLLDDRKLELLVQVSLPPSLFLPVSLQTLISLEQSGVMSYRTQLLLTK